jgi:hypothetical protein
MTNKYFTSLTLKDIICLIGVILIGFGWLLIHQTFLPNVYQRFIVLLLVLLALLFLQFRINKPERIIPYTNTIALILLAFVIIASITIQLVINKNFNYKILFIWFYISILPYIAAFLYENLYQKRFKD